MNTFLLILAIFCIPFIIALFVKKNYNYHRSIAIDRSVETVFDYVKYIKNQDSYSVWNMKDLNKKQTFTGHDGAVGFIYAWDSEHKNAGAGEQEIVRIVENDRIATELRFIRPFKNIATTYTITEPISPNSTKVTWGMTGVNKYPMNLLTLLMKGGLEKDIDQSLNNLKKILEKNSAI